MSIFQAETPAEGTPAQSNPDLDAIKQRYKTTDDLAAGKLEADRTIKARETELAELRAELEKQLQISNARAKLLEGAEPPAKPAVESPAPKPQEDNLDARVEALLKRREEVSAVKSNISTVTSKMTELYGSEDKAKEVVAQKAAELGMTPKQLGEMAAANPKAFFRLIGVDGEKQAEQPAGSSWKNFGARGAPPKAATGGSVNTPGTYKYYEEMRRNDPASYFSPRVQLQRDKDAREKGQAFYS